MRMRADGLVWPCLVMTPVLLLAACATPAPLRPPAGYEELLVMAHEFAESGHAEAALEMYTRAATADPARKEPWQRIARMNLAAGRPARALVAAEEALQRDPADGIANDVYIASGMQIAQQAMQRLLAAGVKSDDAALVRAQQLVATMGLVFGEDALIRDEVKTRYARRAVQQYRAAQARQSQGRLPEEKSRRPDPLDVLGGD